MMALFVCDCMLPVLQLGYTTQASGLILQVDVTVCSEASDPSQLKENMRINCLSSVSVAWTAAQGAVTMYHWDINIADDTALVSIGIK